MRMAVKTCKFAPKSWPLLATMPTTRFAPKSWPLLATMGGSWGFWASFSTTSDMGEGLEQSSVGPCIWSCRARGVQNHLVTHGLCGPSHRSLMAPIAGPDRHGDPDRRSQFPIAGPDRRPLVAPIAGPDQGAPIQGPRSRGPDRRS